MIESYEFLTGDHFHVILHPDKIHGLIFNRLDRTVTTVNYDDAKELSNLKYVGRIYGIVGRFLDRHLVLITGRTRVGRLYEPHSKTDHDVFVITQVQVVDLSSHIKSDDNDSSSTSSKTSNSVKYDVRVDKNDPSDPEKNDFIRMEMKTSDSFSSLPITINTNSYLSNQSRSSNWNPFRLANSLKPIMPTNLLKSSQTSQGLDVQSNHSYKRGDGAPSQPQSLSQSVQTEDADKRLVDEMIKLFNNTNSFYYSHTLDLTNNFARKNFIRKVGNEPAWEAADERFFWNRHMLNDLIKLSKENVDANHFICVILKGFIAVEEHITSSHKFGQDEGIMVRECHGATSLRYINTFQSSGNNYESCDTNFSSIPQSEKPKYKLLKAETYRLALVSRRSVFQAGTRYRRRGCDDDGNCANFVETEQIFKAGRHFTSMVILRGSIPLFWYQSGFNYRPPPVLIRSDQDNHEAFKKHFADLIEQYNTDQIISVDCTEQSGREKAIHDAYKSHMSKFNDTHPRTKLIEFDYHKYCRGRQCTDSQIEQHLNTCGLTEQMLKTVKYYWNDGDVVLNQEGIFRVNCLDCSDRTNVVQRIIALQILDLQLARLGIIAPDANPEENQCKRIMHTMWSTNGNVLSTQYCGTKALFGGDRKLSGYLKDTYSSASRYYISKFRDVYRQAAIDAMLGIESVDVTNLETGQYKDQYELLSFDPMLAGQRGGAILRDMGSRVTNRLARLKGKFNGRHFSSTNSESSGITRFQPRPGLVLGGIAETGLIETLGEMSIDWPSSEDVNKLSIETGREAIETRDVQDVFARYAPCDDNFQDDDEFGQLMLSIDLAELQRLREDESIQQCYATSVPRPNNLTEDIEHTEPEVIDLKEARAISSQTTGKQAENLDDQRTTTTKT